MSLATRCAACGTVFRVVQDQLRVSGGWVRCGRCSEVFNAVESLVDLEIDRPTEGALPSAHGERVMQDLAHVAGPPAPAAPASGTPVPPPSAELDVDAASEADPQPESAPEPPSPEAEEDVPAEALPQGQDLSPQGSAEAMPDEAPEPIATPAFLRRADRAARWRRPRVRAGLALLALLAAMTLALQVTLAYHDTMAARWPAARPLIERVCVYGGCTVEPPRHIERLAVESSSLARSGPPGAFRLSVLLRNRDEVALRMPSIDLSLTDAQGRTLARRVLEPAQLGAPQASIAAGAEQGLSATLRTRDPAVVGYTIEIFYP